MECLIEAEGEAATEDGQRAGRGTLVRRYLGACVLPNRYCIRCIFTGKRVPTQALTESCWRYLHGVITVLVRDFRGSNLPGSVDLPYSGQASLPSSKLSYAKRKPSSHDGQAADGHPRCYSSATTARSSRSS